MSVTPHPSPKAAPLRITMAQINPTVGDIGGNCALVRDVIAAHGQVFGQDHEPSDLIVFPELVTTGYPPEDLVLRPSFIRQVEAHVHTLVSGTKDFKGCAAISSPWVIDGALYNAILAVSAGRIMGVFAKHRLPNYGVFDEKRIFEAGGIPVPLDFHGRKIGFLTCEDIWFPEGANALKSAGAEILIVPNASPYDDAKYAARRDVAAKRSMETGLPLVYVNQIGGQDELVFDGGSFVTDGQGRVTHHLPFFEEAVETIMLSADTIPMAQGAVPQTDRIGDLYRAARLGLRDYVRKNGFKGILIGLSGGIDSALSAVIACDAIGTENVHCVMMPSPYTAQISLDDARDLAHNLGCRYDIMPIEPAMRVFGEILGADAAQGITAENIQSRSRGLILMALSNSGGYMVLSTGNKSEMAVGYATLYGDMCGGFNVLKDIYKTDVFAMSDWCNAQDAAQGRTPRIPQRIITRPPSAELRPDQKDEDSLPPYTVLDAILRGIIELRLGTADLVAQGFDRETIRRVWGLLDRAEYKRRQAPPGVKLTATAFGRERRYPITNRYRDDSA